MSAEKESMSTSSEEDIFDNNPRSATIKRRKRNCDNSLKRPSSSSSSSSPLPSSESGSSSSPTSSARYASTLKDNQEKRKEKKANNGRKKQSIKKSVAILNKRQSTSKKAKRVRTHVEGGLIGKRFIEYDNIPCRSVYKQEGRPGAIFPGWFRVFIWPAVNKTNICAFGSLRIAYYHPERNVTIEARTKFDMLKKYKDLSEELFFWNRCFLQHDRQREFVSRQTVREVMRMLRKERRPANTLVQFSPDLPVFSSESSKASGYSEKESSSKPEESSLGRRENSLTPAEGSLHHSGSMSGTLEDEADTVGQGRHKTSAESTEEESCPPNKSISPSVEAKEQQKANGTNYDLSTDVEQSETDSETICTAREEAKKSGFEIASNSPSIRDGIASSCSTSFSLSPALPKGTRTPSVDDHHGVEGTSLSGTTTPMPDTESQLGWFEEDDELLNALFPPFDNQAASENDELMLGVLETLADKDGRITASATDVSPGKETMHYPSPVEDEGKHGPKALESICGSSDGHTYYLGSFLVGATADQRKEVNDSGIDQREEGKKGDSDQSTKIETKVDVDFPENGLLLPPPTLGSQELKALFNDGDNDELMEKYFCGLESLNREKEEALAPLEKVENVSVNKENAAVKGNGMAERCETSASDNNRENETFVDDPSMCFLEKWLYSPFTFPLEVWIRPEMRLHISDTTSLVTGGQKYNPALGPCNSGVEIRGSFFRENNEICVLMEIANTSAPESGLQITSMDVTVEQWAKIYYAKTKYCNTDGNYGKQNFSIKVNERKEITIRLSSRQVEMDKLLRREWGADLNNHQNMIEGNFKYLDYMSTKHLMFSFELLCEFTKPSKSPLLTWLQGGKNEIMVPACLRDTLTFSVMAPMHVFLEESAKSWYQGGAIQLCLQSQSVNCFSWEVQCDIACANRPSTNYEFLAGLLDYLARVLNLNGTISEADLRPVGGDNKEYDWDRADEGREDDEDDNDATDDNARQGNGKDSKIYNVWFHAEAHLLAQLKVVFCGKMTLNPATVCPPGNSIPGSLNITTHSSTPTFLDSFRKSLDEAIRLYCRKCNWNLPKIFNM